MTGFFSARPPFLQSLDEPLWRQCGLGFDVLRLDQMHPLVHGNKGFKLKYNIRAARDAGHQTLLSFGGAYSNHLRALAATARSVGMDSIGIVRGEASWPLNPVLQFAREQGMRLFFVSRADYRNKNDPTFLKTLEQRFGSFYLIPEGGDNEAGIRGAEEIADLLAPHLDNDGGRPPVIAVACGTGATLAGLVRGTQRLGVSTRILGIAVLKGEGYLQRRVAARLGTGSGLDNWQIVEDYHFGGYARSSRALDTFVADFTGRTGIPLEPVYTGKLVFGLYEMARLGKFKSPGRLIWLHTGGLYN